MTQQKNETPEINWKALAEFIGVSPSLSSIWSAEDKRWALDKALEIITPSKSTFENHKVKSNLNPWEW
tara:strand:- start:98 stop:301 length:204 start_codon:yes stop_codon:yes gene_type:complete